MTNTLEFFATDDAVAALEATLAPTSKSLDEVARTQTLVALAWQMRQRDTKRALTLAEEAERRLSIPAGAESVPGSTANLASNFISAAPQDAAAHPYSETERQRLAARLMLIRAEAKWLLGEIDASKALAESALHGFGAFGDMPDDALGSADAHWLLAWLAVEQGDLACTNAELLAMTAAATDIDPVRSTMAQATMARFAAFSDVSAATERWNSHLSHDAAALHPATASAIEDFWGAVAMLSSDFVQSIRHWSNTYSMALASGQQRRAMVAALNVGVSFASLNDHQAALEWMRRGLDLARPTGWPGMVGMALFQTANTLHRLQRFDAAVDMLEESLALMAPLSASRNYALALQYLGDVEFDRLHYARSLDSYRLLEQRAVALAQTDLLSDAQRGQARALLELGQAEPALQAAEAALHTTKSDTFGQIAALRVMADIHTRFTLPPPTGMSAASAPLHYLHLALDAAADIENFTIPSDLLEAVAQAYANVGDTGKAFALAKRAIAARKKLHGTQASNRASAIQVSHATAALRQSETRLMQTLFEHKAILESASVGIMFLKDRIIQRCNRRAAELFGHTPHEMVGHSTRFLYRSQGRFEEVGAQSYPEIMRGQTHSGEYEVTRRDGSVFWCRMTGKAVDPTHPEREIVWVLEDVTVQRAAREELESRVQERTAELAESNVRLRREIIDREEAEKRLSHLASHDALTGFPGRRLLLDRVAQACALSRRDNKSAAVVFLDLDRFKTINDSFGHTVGDELLRQVGKRVLEVLREGDTVARLAGDQFAVLLPQVGDKTAVASVAGKVIGALSLPFQVEGHELLCTASLGIALFPGDADAPEGLLRNAEAAMRHAKETGRNCSEFFAPSMAEHAVQHRGLENDLRRALLAGQLELHYQPRIDLDSGALCGFEALVRWNHPERGRIMPDVFIPLAEESGLISRIGEWVLSTACAQWIQWRHQGCTVPMISVNLSPHQFHQRDLAECIQKTLADAGVDPAHIELEITETSLMQHVEQTLATLERLRAAGFRLAIDDFGVGYSSLSYLKRFPVHEIKIDKSFMRDLTPDGGNAAIVSAITTLAHHMRLTVVAEGVETTEQLQTVSALGCSEVQGYLFSPPVPADHVPGLLKVRWINQLEARTLPA